MNRTKERFESTPIAFTVLGAIRKQLDEFTPRHRAFAEYVLQHPESLAFFSITDIAKESGVSQTTIVRFCNVLGYNGYAQLVREVRQTLQSEIGSAGRFKIVRQMRKDTKKPKTLSTFERLLNQELENLANLFKSIKSTDFYHCIDVMTKADQICIIGCMSSTSLALFFGDILSKTFSGVDVLHGHGVNAPAIFQRLSEKSLVFLISFPQYAKTTVELGRFAVGEKAYIVAITDNNNSPIVPLADIVFLIPVNMQSYMESYSAPMALISVLVNALAERHPEKTEKVLLKYDEYSSQMNLYKVSRERIKYKR
jgi:DNA-binding MurR/RpiR family transcriptional regulator